MTWEEAIAEINALHVSKGADYGTDDDPYANVRSAERLGIPGWVQGCALVEHKVTRVGSFLRNGRLRNEPVRDAIKDMATYAVIALVLWDEEHAEPEAPDDEMCPTCHSLSRSYRDKMWSDERATWIDCEDSWHDAAS